MVDRTAVSAAAAEVAAVAEASVVEEVSVAAPLVVLDSEVVARVECHCSECAQKCQSRKICTPDRVHQPRIPCQSANANRW